ncbi:MAG: GTPase [Planctomycetota bacterium]
MTSSSQPGPGATAEVLTPAGRSAIAVVLVEGPAAAAAVDANFRAANGKPAAEQPIDRIVFGHWFGDGFGYGFGYGGRRGDAANGPGEELIVCRVADHAFEVHCHGGYAAVEAIMASLVGAGCQAIEPAAPPEATEPTSVDAEARHALASCVTERAAGVLLDQLSGALTREVEAIATLLSADKRQDAEGRLRTLLSRVPVGLRLTRPWRVVLAGPANVGKSSLLNALVGYERAVVFDQPGVTRDVVTAAAAIDGWPVELADTAGLRKTPDGLEAAGVGLARRAIQGADLVLLVSAPGTPDASDASLAVEAAGGRLLRVANKSDLSLSAECGSGPCEGVAVSALTGAGLPELIAAIAGRLAPHPPAPGDAVPFTERQARLLRAGADALAAGDTTAARRAMTVLLAGAAFPGADAPRGSGLKSGGPG